MAEVCVVSSLHSAKQTKPIDPNPWLTGRRFALSSSNVLSLQQEGEKIPVFGTPKRQKIMKKLICDPSFTPFFLAYQLLRYTSRDCVAEHKVSSGGVR
jgi:hypothetical protein